VCVGGENSRASLAASLSARAPGRGSLRAPDAAASAKTAPSCAPRGERDETCPVSTEGWTRRVHFVREGVGGGEGGTDTLGGGAGVWRLHRVREAPRKALRQGKNAQRGPKPKWTRSNS
jgi:hypothetical protein